jgi:hypothetical protein
MLYTTILGFLAAQYFSELLYSNDNVDADEEIP